MQDEEELLQKIENERFKNVYRDKNGNKIDSEKLEELLRNQDYKIVAGECIDNVYISTVWLGIGFGLGIHYFETASFKDGKFIDVINRYSTLMQAKKGHQEIVKLMKENLSNG